MLRGFLWLTAACGFVLSLMVLLGSQAGAAFLLYALERQSAPVRSEQLRTVEAIVVLGGRTHRAHYAAALHRQSGLPLLLTGKGTGDHPYAAESQKMVEILHQQYRITPRWVEAESFDTLENALYSRCILAGAAITRVALLTDPVHMPRARALFEAAGFHVVPAPAPDAPRRNHPLTLDSFVPSGDGLDAARYPAAEWAGRLLAPLSVARRRGDCGSRAPLP
ncbi:YdcF family protein [Ramlibacter montanisoli]|uniref:YdcF family protein n=1 Tax=Ramlibacter montanisoli TaxID=2732512 RepID=A0A849K5H9_9BURK|nr:YdcF family protein [Ramlibacter montanisoli]NNU43648.1 YdcF family protein [Ramlibacter montanisoli]